MRQRAYIVFILLLTYCLQVAGQRFHTLMAGTKGAKYWVTGTPGMKYYWTVQGGTIINGANESTVYIDWNNKPGNYKISVYGETPEGCLSIVKELDVTLFNSNVPYLDSEVYICDGDSFTYDAGPGFISYNWNDNKEGRYNTIRKSGRVIVVVGDSLGNSSSAVSNLIVRPLPKINLGNDTILCGKSALMLDAGKFANVFNWSTGDSTQIIAVKPPTKIKEEFWVVGQDQFGCRSSDTIRIYTCNIPQYSKKVPTAFTPNDDGQNDCWELPEIEQYTKCTIEVFDRWGRLVYKANRGYNTKWCGLDMSGQKLPIDSYFYIIDLNVGKDKPIVGSITILR